MKKRKIINCPLCHQKQMMEYDKTDKVWFPITPFCCDVMRTADTPEWNALIDKAIENES